MREILHIAMDFDDTFTADVEAFLGVIATLERFGHRVYIVTARGREDIDEISRATGLSKGRIYCTGGSAKKWFMNRTDVEIDIWIDDQPEMILNAR